ncbi:hypothetical protein P7K49_040622, partial [Saguinus oedipus]
LTCGYGWTRKTSALQRCHDSSVAAVEYPRSLAHTWMDEKTLSPAGWRGSSVGDVESVRWLPRTWTWLDEEALCAAAGTCVFSEGCGVSYVVSSHVDVAGQGSLPPCSGAVTLCVGSVVTKHLCIHLWKAERSHSSVRCFSRTVYFPRVTLGNQEFRLQKLASFYGK